MKKVPKEVSQYMASLARKGHQVTYKKRYDIITELRKYTSKKELDAKLSWKTEALEELLKVYKKLS